MKLFTIVAFVVLWTVAGVGVCAEPSIENLLLDEDHSAAWQDEADVTLNFDRNQCEDECRARFGMATYGRYGSRPPAYYLLADCLRKCDRRFWKDFDRRSRDIENE